MAIFLLTSAAHASQLDDKRKELRKVKAKIDADRGMIDAAKKSQAKIIREIDQNDQKISHLQPEIAKLESELNITSAKKARIETALRKAEGELSAAEAELTIVERKLEYKREIYNNRLSNVYKNGKLSILETLLSSRDIGDLIQLTTLLERITKNDSLLVFEMKRSRTIVAEKVRQIETKKNTIAKQRLVLVDEENRVKTIRDRLTAQRNLLQGELNKQKAIFAKLQKQKIQLEGSLDVLESTSNMVADQIRTLERGGKISVSRSLRRASIGRFMRPCPGPITSKFGWRFHPILRRSRLHAGVDISAPYGTVIRAAQSGVVIMAGWRGGYGKTVVISHGGSITTLYGHSSRLLVSAGQFVDQGQPIAHSGSTGLSTGPHLHFEVRVNGSPKDPMKWL